MVTGHRTENLSADVLVNFVRSWLKEIQQYEKKIVFITVFLNFD